VYKVPDASPIHCGVVLAIDSELAPFLYDDLLNYGEEIGGKAEGLITYEMRLMRTAGIEESESDYPPIRMHFCQSTDEHFST
jgi:hypothetical protein